MVMAAPTVSDVASARVDLADNAPAIHHQNPIRHAEHFRQFARDHQNGKPVLGETRHQGVNFRLGADIDAARRLVHDEDARLGGEPFGEDDFLLIAARQLPRRLVGTACPDARVSR